MGCRFISWLCYCWCDGICLNGQREQERVMVGLLRKKKKGRNQEKEQAHFKLNWIENERAQGGKVALGIGSQGNQNKPIWLPDLWKHALGQLLLNKLWVTSSSLDQVYALSFISLYTFKVINYASLFCLECTSKTIKIGKMEVHLNIKIRVIMIHTSCSILQLWFQEYFSGHSSRQQWATNFPMMVLQSKQNQIQQ